MVEGSAVGERAVLVVEDDDDVREIVADLIETSGRRACTARDGSDALTKLDSGEIPRPCLIILDWLMYPMNGKEFLAQLNARSDYDQLRVVVTSADAHVPPETLIPRVIGRLRKPFTVEELLPLLDEHC